MKHETFSGIKILARKLRRKRPENLISEIVYGNPGIPRWTPLPGPNTVSRRQTKVVISEKCPKMMGVRNVDLGEIIDGRALESSRSPFRRLRCCCPTSLPNTHESSQPSQGGPEICAGILTSMIAG
jgi:hypothetical protein